MFISFEAEFWAREVGEVETTSNDNYRHNSTKRRVQTFSLDMLLKHKLLISK